MSKVFPDIREENNTVSVPKLCAIKRIAVLIGYSVLSQPPPESFGYLPFLEKDCARFLCRYSVNCFHTSTV